MSPRLPPNDASHHSDHDVELDKSTIVQLEQVHNGNLTPEEASFLASFSDEQKRVVLRKVDWRLVPMLLVLYLISFIDRANIGMVACGTNIESMTDDTRQCKDRGPFAGSQYDWNAVQHRFGKFLVRILTIVCFEWLADSLVVCSSILIARPLMGSDCCWHDSDFGRSLG